MGVTNVNELMAQQSSTLDKEGKRKHSRVFQAITDNKYDSTWTVLIAASVALGIELGTIHAADPGAQCVNWSCRNVENYRYEVTFDFESFPPEEDPDPFSRPTEHEWTFSKFQRPIDQTVTGGAIVNSAGDPFSEAVQRDDSRAVLKVKRAEQSFNRDLAWQMIDSVNASEFFGAPQGTAKCSNINSKFTPDEEHGDYYDTSYEFEFKAEGWEVSLLDQGYRELNDDDELVPVTLNGQPVNEPVLLDGDGRKLDAEGTPVFLTFQIYPEVGFEVFNFGD